jgi:hypothetical protein
MNKLIQEKALSQIAAKIIQSNIRNEISSTFERRSGALSKSVVLSKTNAFGNVRLILKGPKYSFIQHYGYTREYKSGKVYVSPPKEHISKAVGNIPFELAAQLSALWSIEFGALIKTKNNG